MIHKHLKPVDIQARKFQFYQQVWHVLRKKSLKKLNLKNLSNNLRRRKKRPQDKGRKGEQWN